MLKEERLNYIRTSNELFHRNRKSRARLAGQKVHAVLSTKVKSKCLRPLILSSKLEDSFELDTDEGEKKDKKLVFLSKSVLQKVRELPMVTGTQIANEILEMYKDFCDVSQPKNLTAN